MNAIWIILILGANFAIAWLNANNVGKYWTEAKMIKGSFRAYVVCGFVLSIIGFTTVYDCILMLIAEAILTSAGATRQAILQFAELNSDILYILSVFTVIPAGFFVTGCSLKNAFEKRTVSYSLNAGWNSYAQIRNTIDAARNAPSAIGRVIGFFFKKDDDSNDLKSKLIGFVAIAVLVVAVLGGYCTASAILKRADRKYDAFASAQPNIAMDDIDPATPMTAPRRAAKNRAPVYNSASGRSPSPDFER